MGRGAKFTRCRHLVLKGVARAARTKGDFRPVPRTPRANRWGDSLQIYRTGAVSSKLNLKPILIFAGFNFNIVCLFHHFYKT